MIRNTDRSEGLSNQSVHADGSSREKMSAKAKEICIECSRLDECICEAKDDVLVQGCAITDYILHRYYDHKIIPLQEKYADLRNGQEEWYDEQVKNGMCDEYQYGVLGRSRPIKVRHTNE